MLVFYGASWNSKSISVAAAINTFIDSVHHLDDPFPPKVEVLYLSNDRSEQEFESFIRKMNDKKPWCSLPWNDDKIQEIKEKFGLDSLPRVLVFDKNLELVTDNGAEDLVFLPPSACKSYWNQQLASRVNEEAVDDEKDE